MASFLSLPLYQIWLQVGTNIHPNRPQIQPVGASKSMNLGFKIGLGGLLEGSWRVLGGSWGHLGPKMPPSWPQEPYMIEFVNKSYASWGPSWGLKSFKISSKSDPKCDRFFDSLENRFLQRFGANLVPSWPSKPSPNGAKLAPKLFQVGVLIWELFLKWSCYNFYWFFITTWHGRSSEKYTKHADF